MRLSNLREAAAGKGEGPAFEGQWDKAGRPQWPPPTGAPGRSGERRAARLLW